MRVAFLSHAAPAGDAIGRQLAEKVAVFVDRGADVRLFVTSDRRLHPALRPYTQRYTPAVPSGPQWDFLSSADLVFVEYSQHDPLFDLLPLLSGGRPKIIFDYHGVTPPNLGVPNHRDALERGCRLRGLVWTADLAVAHSRFAASELAGDTGVPVDRIRRLGLPVDVEWFAPGMAQQPLRPRLGLPPEVRLLLFVGRLAPNKRVRVLVEALASLRDQSPAVHAVIVGDGGDAYGPERDRCRERAARFGVANRLHFLGQLDEPSLRDAYRDADVLIMPSVHEGFCIPVVEALACGKPVIAARAAALPETVGDAGLTFAPDDPADLARQLRRVLAPSPAKLNRKVGRRRIAVVAVRYGAGFVGGAETSLRTLARSVAAAGHGVEVFTTGTVEGTGSIDGLPVHRFRPNPVDSERHAAAAEMLRLPGGLNDSAAVEDFFNHSVRSARLMDTLRERGPFDAVLVGPYLNGLTHDVATAFGDRVLLMPCFHDEPFARLPALLDAYRNVGGVLYHSREERDFAEGVLGINQPNAHVIGTLLYVDTPGDAREGRRLVGTGRRYLLYAGRYCREKGLPELLAFARRYAAEKPEKFTFAFIGEGDEPIPPESWARDLGFVDELSRQDLMAGADALVMLSPNESLSLAALEAQAQGTPIMVRAGNAVLESHVAAGKGGVAVDGYESFAAAVDDLWADPNHWRALGRSGREYVRREYGRPNAYSSAWSAALVGLDEPLTEAVRKNGLRRAGLFDRKNWRKQFCQLVDVVLEAPAPPRIESLEIAPRVQRVEAGVQQAELVLPVRLSNRGERVFVSEGPARTELITQVLTARGEAAGPVTVTPPPGLLVPGRSVAAIVRVAVPTVAGDFDIRIRSRRPNADGTFEYLDARPVPMPSLSVTAGTLAVSPAVIPTFEPLLRFAQAAHELPAGYADVSEGRFARLKRWVKRKLLHNFQTAYVDVISRQQTAFNLRVLTALAELGDGQSALNHAVTTQPPRSAAQDGDDLRVEIRRLRQENRRLRRRLIRLEAVLPTAAETLREAAA